MEKVRFKSKLQVVCLSKWRLFSEETRMQLQTCLTLITSLLLVGALNYHLSNMGTPSIIKSTDFNLRDYLQTTFLAGREFGQPELDTDDDYNNVLLLRLVKSPATRSGTRREHISRIN